MENEIHVYLGDVEDSLLLFEAVAHLVATQAALLDNKGEVPSGTQLLVQRFLDKSSDTRSNLNNAKRLVEGVFRGIVHDKAEIRRLEQQISNVAKKLEEGNLNLREFGIYEGPNSGV
jgi:hypothetical protein